MTNGHRRRAVILLVALATLAVADQSVRRLRPTLRAYTVADYQRKPAALATGPMPGVVLMGSSRAKYALVPEEFENLTGRQTFNLGIAGSKVVEWLALSRILFREARPELVVLGINASEVRQDYAPTEAARNLFSFTDLLESVTRDGPSLDVIGAYLRRTTAPLWAVYDQRYELRMWSQEHLAAALPKHAQHARELRERVAAPLPEKGFEHPWAQGRQLRSVEERLLGNVASVEAATIPQFSPTAPAIERLGQLFDELRAKEIETIVVYIPNCPRTEERWNSVEPIAIETIAAICDGHGVPFIPCPPSEVPRTNRDFIEEIHVGLPLARTISRRAARAAVAAGLLPLDAPRLVNYEQGATD
ncbi:MAG: hypothetical protein HZA51_09385 [Planctomycetes bacterium]|nr:hypothetical protein [Planctomycetota bacterium]